MTTELAVSKTANENLTLLGVDGSKNPTVSRYPKAYNPGAHGAWVRALSSVTLGEDTLANWMLAIRAFLKICRDEGFEPFNNSNIEVINDGIESWLKSNRLKCIKYADDSGIFKHFNIRSVKRTVSVSGQQDRNFFVKNVAQLKAIEDPTLEKWLLTNPMPGFVSNNAGLYTKNVNAATRIEVNFSSRTSATIALEIYCHSLPVVPNKQTKKALAKHIETNMWVPLVKRYKFSGIGSKQF